MLNAVDAINKYVNMFKDCKISLKNKQNAHRSSTHIFSRVLAPNIIRKMLFFNNEVLVWLTSSRKLWQISREFQPPIKFDMKIENIMLEVELKLKPNSILQCNSKTQHENVLSIHQFDIPFSLFQEWLIDFVCVQAKVPVTQYALLCTVHCTLNGLTIAR